MSDYSRPIRELPGLGPKSEKMLAAVGVTLIEQFLAADPYEIYARLKASEQMSGLNFLYAIIGAQQGVHWQQVARERKTEILMRLDDLGLAPK